jgi:predicted secreted acid phosphatase
MKGHPMKRTLQTLLPIFLAFSASSCWAVPANQILIPDDPHFARLDGIAESRTAPFQTELEKTAQAARSFCEAHRTTQGIPAVVVDIDETVLDNREEWEREAKAHPEDPNKFDPSSYNNWVQKGIAPEITPIADFVRWADSNGFKVFFISGRTTDQRRATEANFKLHNIPFHEIFLKPAGTTAPAEIFKTEYRRLIESSGYTIVCNIGDQQSDLYGLYSMDCEKVPNSMYFLP